MVQRIINATPSVPLGVSPSTLVYGARVDLDRHLVPTRLPSAVHQRLEVIRDEQRKVAVADYLQHMCEVQQILLQRAQEHQMQYSMARLARYKPSKPETFEVGDWVLLNWPGDRPPDKLSPRWRGPFSVAGYDSTRGYYQLQDPTDLSILSPSVAGDRLRRYHLGLTSFRATLGVLGPSPIHRLAPSEKSS